MDFNELLQRGAIQQSSQASDPNSKPEDIFDLITKAIERAIGQFSKFSGVNLSNLFSTGIFRNFNFQEGGIKVDNPMMQKNLDVQGGALANIAFGEMFTRAGLALPNMGSDAGGGSSGGGGGGGGDYSGQSAFSEMIVAAGGGNHFAWQPELMESLGNLRPSATPAGGGMGLGGGMEMG